MVLIQVAFVRLFFFVRFMTLDYYEISQNLSFSILDPEFFGSTLSFFGSTLSFLGFNLSFS